MTVRRSTPALLLLFLCCVLLPSAACIRMSGLPAALTDKEFWTLIEAVSEPPGSFNVTENFVSNERRFAENIRRVQSTGGVYIGVGPEQNFSYIAGFRPRMAFIVDIRRENLNLHLLYKALFELSSDRGDFISRLFSRPCPPGLDSSATLEQVFARYAAVPSSPKQYERTRTLVHDRLVKTRGLPLSEADLEWIDRAFKAFYDDGPEIQFWGARSVHGIRPTYRQLMMTVDFSGQYRSFLATEEGFRFVKEMQSKNLIVPVVGDFGGPTAVRRVGDYVRRHADVVQAFYGSNVGVYLSNQQMRAFCGNLASLPAAPAAWFVESDSVRLLSSKVKSCSAEAR